MATFKATSSKNSSGGGVFKATKSKSYDSAYVNRWEKENEEAVNILNDYITRRKNGDWMSEDDINNYRSALDMYKSSSESLAGLNRSFGNYNEDDDKSRQSYISSLMSDMDDSSRMYGRFGNADEYKTAVASNKEREEMKTANLSDLEEEIKALGDELKAEEGKVGKLFGWIMSDEQKDKTYGTNISGLKSSLDNKKRYYDSAVAVQDYESHTTDELYKLAEEAANNDDSLYYRGLANQKAVQDKSEILANTQMDGENVSVLDAMYDLSRIEDKDERKEREDVIKNKMSSLGIDFDDYYSRITGEKNITAEGVGNWLGATFNSGLNAWNKGVSSTLDLILGKPLQSLGWENNPLSASAKLYDEMYDNYVFNRNLYSEKMGGGEAFDIAGKLGESLIAAVPDAVLAFMTAGASKASSLSTTAAYASGDKLTKAGLTVQNMAKNPSYWSSFARTYGLDYEEAISMGASEPVAVFGATISSLINAGIETGIDGGSGFQGFAQDLADGNKSKFFAWVESSLEEGGEEILQGFVNNLVSKTLYDDSVQLANLGDMIAEGAMGTAVGAVLGGGQTVIASGYNKAAQAAAMNDMYRARGQAILDEGGMDTLQSLANEVAGAVGGRQGKAISAQAAKVNAKNGVNTKAIGKLYATVDTVRQEQNKADLTKALEEKGVSKRNAKKYADILFQMNEGYYSGEKSAFTLGTDEQWREITGDEKAYSVLRSIVTDEKSPVNIRNLKQAGAARGIRVDETGKLNKEDLNAYQERVVAKITGGGLAGSVKNDLNVSLDGKTVIEGIDDEITNWEFTDSEDGSLKIKANGDKVADIGSVSFGDVSEAYVVSAIVDMGVSAEDANTLFGMLNGKGENVGKAFANGISLAFKYGRYFYSPNKLANIAGISKEQALEAFKIGRRSRDKGAKADQSQLNAVAESNTAEGKTASTKGSVVFEGAIADENGNLAAGEDSLTEIQKASVNGLKLIAELSPINFHIFQSTKDGKTYSYVKQNGEKTHANGWYRVGTNDIYIDLNAGNLGEGTMMYTAAHEISHFIKEYSPQKWDKVAEYIMNEYCSHYGGKVDTLLLRHIASIKNRADSQNKIQQEIEDEAFEDLVCDSLSKMLIDGTVVQAMANIKQKNKGVWNTIKNAVMKLLEKWSAVIDQYKGRTPDAEEASYFTETSKAFKDLKAMLTDAFVDAGETYSKVGNIKQSKSDVLSERDTAEESKAIEAFGDDLGTVERNANGDMLIATNKDSSTVVYSERTWNDGGKDKFIALMTTLGHGEQAQEYAKYLDDALDYLHELAVGYKILGQHLDATITTDIKNGKQVLSSIVNNGEYPVNIDLALICKKRVAYMRLMAKMIEDGVFGDVKYDGDAIAEVNAILRKNGFETACLGCFVESRRLQFQTWAETIVQEWNEAVEARNKHAHYFRFADGKAALTEEDIKTLDSELASGGKKNDKGNLNLGQGSVADKMGRLLDKVPSLARKLTVDDLLTPQGLTALRATDGNLFSLVKQRYGAASPKIVQDYNPYASEIADLTFKYVKDITGNAVKGAQDYIKAAKAEVGVAHKKQKGESKEDFAKRKAEYDTKVEALAMRKYLYSIGGARIQSFSDFMIENVFDYLQIFADLTAKELPMHGYTKEIAALRLFGMTGARWNGSLIAHVEKSMGKEYAGLLPASEAKNGNGILVKVDGKDYCIGFDDFARNKATNGKSFIQSIGMKDIIALMYDPRYSPYVGNITIGVSDKQIMAMLDSPLFRMVIPYHASGMLPQFAQLVGVDMYNDYTNYQNTTVKEIRLVDDANYTVKIGDNGKPKLVKNADGKDVGINTHYAFNEMLQKYGDARKTCQDYLAWCRNDHPIYDKGKLVGYASFSPKFSDSPTGVDFTKHRNYYKLIEDFNTYDNITEKASQQGAVTMTFPSAENRLTADRKAAYEKALRDTGIFTDADIKKYLDKADMTFEDIVRAEVGNRKAYNADQEPKFNSTVKEVEDYLLNAKDENGNYKFRRDAIADTASDYIEAKNRGISLKPATGSYMDEITKLGADYGVDKLSDRDTIRKFDHSADAIARNVETVAGMDSVHDVPAGALEDSGKPINEIYQEFFDKWGGELFSEELGVIDVKPSSIRSEKRHGSTAQKIASIEAIPTVVNEGKVIFANYKDGTDVLRIVVAAPIKIDGKPYYMGVMVQRDTKFQRLYLHDVVIEEETPDFSQVDLLTTGTDEKNERLFVTTILQQALKVKYEHRNEQKTEAQFLNQDRDTEPISNRALLANALESTIDTSTQEGQNELRKLNEYKAMVGTLDELNAKLTELRSGLFSKGTTGTERKKMQEEATKMANRISIYDKKLLTLEASKPLKKVLDREKAEAVKRQKKRDAEVLKTYRDRSEAKLKKQAEYYQESRKKAVEKVRETRDKRDARDKLQKLVLDTVKWISYPAKTDVKCPDILKQPYADFLNGIDLSSQRLAKGGDPTKNDLRLTSAMDSLATALEKIMISQDPNQEAGTVLDTGYLDLPANFVQKLRDMTEDIKAMMVEGDYVINNMSADEVRQLSQMIRTLNRAIKEVSTLYANLRFANVEVLGNATMSFMDVLGEVEKTSGMKDFAEWENALPYYAFKRFGEGGESIFEGLMDAQDKLAFLAQKIFDFREKAWTSKEAKEWSEDTHTIELPNGNTLTLTTADAMSIYCLSRREHGLQHLLGGGTRVVGIQKGSKKAKDSRSTLTINDISAINSSLTDRQRTVAEAIQEFMSTVCAEWGNEISMKRFLTRDFNEKFYFPIESNDENLPTKDPSAQQSDLFRLLNISATKPIDPRANNEVIIRNIFDVFTNHSSDMARLNAYGMPLLDYMKWLNYREKTVNEEGQITVRGVRKSMEKAYGNAAKSYVLNLVKDVNGRASDGGDPTILMKWMRAAKTASVGNSLRVATLQLTSYPRAALILSQKSLLQGLTKMPQIEKAKKYCGIALWKSFGFYDTNIARSIEDQMKGVTDIRQKLIELSLKGAELGDAITWGCLWNACEYEVAKSTKSKVGSDEFYREVGKKLREVVYATQVVDSTLTRSQMMRSKRGMAQEAAAFMSEPTLSYNILMDAGFQFSAEQRRTGSAKAAWKKVGKYIRRAVAVYSISQLTAALLESLWDAWRDDGDEEFGEKHLNAFVENLALDLVPFNKIPILSDVFEAALALFDIGFYSSDKMSTTWLTQTVSAVDAWKDVLGGESSATTYNALYKTAKAVSSFAGVSVSGFMRECVALWNNTAGAYDANLKIKSYEDTNTENGNNLYEAIVSGDDKKADQYEQRFDNDKEVDAALRKALRENDPRIKEALKIRVNEGVTNKYHSIREEIISEGNFEPGIVNGALKAEYNYFNNKVEEAADLLKDGDKEASDDIIRDLKKKYKGTFTQDDILKAVKRRAGLLK